MARLGLYAGAAWVAISLNFLLPRAMPGSPLALLAGSDVASLSRQDREALVTDAGLDRPLAAQYVRYLRDLARGELGYSFQRRVPVADLLAERLPWTLLLTGTSQLLALVVGIGLGAWAASQAGRAVDAALLTTVLTLDALPLFWIGMVLIAGFAVQLPLFPPFGAVAPFQSLTGIAWVADVARHLVLPLLALLIGSVAGPLLVTRAALSPVLRETFVTAARARGLARWAATTRHGLRSVLMPITSTVAMNLAFAVGGTTLIETVFSYPGIGRLTYEAILSRDYPVIQGTFLVTTLVVLTANLIVDVAAPWLDPRLRRRRPTGAPA
jgi:peptide/nickel transport system permease protein